MLSCRYFGFSYWITIIAREKQKKIPKKSQGFVNNCSLMTLCCRTLTVCHERGRPDGGITTTSWIQWFDPIRPFENGTGTVKISKVPWYGTGSGIKAHTKISHVRSIEKNTYIHNQTTQYSRFCMRLSCLLRWGFYYANKRQWRFSCAIENSNVI